MRVAASSVGSLALFAALFIAIFYVGFTSLSSVGSSPSLESPSSIAIIWALLLAGIYFFVLKKGRRR